MSPRFPRTFSHSKNDTRSQEQSFETIEEPATLTQTDEKDTSSPQMSSSRARRPAMEAVAGRFSWSQKTTRRPSDPPPKPANTNESLRKPRLSGLLPNRSSSSSSKASDTSFRVLGVRDQQTGYFDRPKHSEAASPSDLVVSPAESFSLASGASPRSMATGIESPGSVIVDDPGSEHSNRPTSIRQTPIPYTDSRKRHSFLGITRRLSGIPQAHSSSSLTESGQADGSFVLKSMRRVQLEGDTTSFECSPDLDSWTDVAYDEPPIDDHTSRSLTPDGATAPETVTAPTSPMMSERSTSRSGLYSEPMLPSSSISVAKFKGKASRPGSGAATPAPAVPSLGMSTGSTLGQDTDGLSTAQRLAALEAEVAQGGRSKPLLARLAERHAAVERSKPSPPSGEPTRRRKSFRRASSPLSPEFRRSSSLHHRTSQTGSSRNRQVSHDSGLLGDKQLSVRPMSSALRVRRFSDRLDSRAQLASSRSFIGPSIVVNGDDQTAQSAIPSQSGPFDTSATTALPTMEHQGRQPIADQSGAAGRPVFPDAGSDEGHIHGLKPSHPSPQTSSHVMSPGYEGIDPNVGAAMPEGLDDEDKRFYMHQHRQALLEAEEAFKKAYDERMRPVLAALQATTLSEMPAQAPTPTQHTLSHSAAPAFEYETISAFPQTSPPSIAAVLTENAVMLSS